MKKYIIGINIEIFMVNLLLVFVDLIIKASLLVVGWNLILIPYLHLSAAYKISFFASFVISSLILGMLITPALISPLVTLEGEYYDTDK